MLRLDFLSNDYQDTRSSVEKTTDAIAIEILTGILRQGRHLAEQQLCERYQLSRTPIREVLKNLESLGLIELIPNRGAIVRGLPASALDDLFLYESAALSAVRALGHRAHHAGGVFHAGGNLRVYGILHCYGRYGKNAKNQPRF